MEMAGVRPVGPSGSGADKGANGPHVHTWLYTVWDAYRPSYIALDDFVSCIASLPTLAGTSRIYYATAAAIHDCPTTGQRHVHVFVDQSTQAKRGFIAPDIVHALRSHDDRYSRYETLRADVAAWFRAAHGLVVRSYRGAWEYVTGEKEGWNPSDHGYIRHVTGGKPRYTFKKVKKDVTDNDFVVFRLDSQRRVYCIPWQEAVKKYGL